MAYGTLRCDTIQSDGGTAKTVNDLVASGGDIGAATATQPATSDGAGTNDTRVATTKFVKDQAYATLASPTFTGTVTLPAGTVATTATQGDNDTSVATTAFVTTAANARASTAANTFSAAQAVTPSVQTSAGALDMDASNFIEVAGVSYNTTPTGLVVGTSGLFYADTAAPTNWHSTFKFVTGGYVAPTTFPAVAPWYVAETDEILVGAWTQGISVAGS